MTTQLQENRNGSTPKPSVREQFRQRRENKPELKNLDEFSSWMISAVWIAVSWVQVAFDVFISWLLSLNWWLITWNAITTPLVGMLYWVVNAQGIRSEIPIFAMKLYKLPLPGFSILREYEGLYHLDLAHVLAILLLGFVYYFWTVVVKVMLYGHDDIVDPNLNRSTYYVFLFTLAGVMIVGDAIVFYCGLFDHVGSLWGESSGFVPFVATVLYMGLLAATSMVHVHLTIRHRVART